MGTPHTPTRTLRAVEAGQAVHAVHLHVALRDANHKLVQGEIVRLILVLEVDKLLRVHRLVTVVQGLDVGEAAAAVVAHVRVVHLDLGVGHLVLVKVPVLGAIAGRVPRILR